MQNPECRSLSLMPQDNKDNINMKRTLREGLQNADLEDTVSNRIHIDEFKSKMGRDEDIVVVSFKTMNKEPGLDLSDFFEKGYEFILDADVSSGDIGDGDYLVFVELERSRKVIDQILKIVSELGNLTGMDTKELRFRYGKSIKKHPITKEELEQYVPLTPEEYLQKYPNTDDIDAMKTMAQLPVESKAPVNDWTDGWRILSGIK